MRNATGSGLKTDNDRYNNKLMIEVERYYNSIM